jgi:hypothetical protein
LLAGAANEIAIRENTISLVLLVGLFVDVSPTPGESHVNENYEDGEL